jgi:hypothetical protein
MKTFWLMVLSVLFGFYATHRVTRGSLLVSHPSPEELPEIVDQLPAQSAQLATPLYLVQNVVGVDCDQRTLRVSSMAASELCRSSLVDLGVLEPCMTDDVACQEGLEIRFTEASWNSELCGTELEFGSWLSWRARRDRLPGMAVSFFYPRSKLEFDVWGYSADNPVSDSGNRYLRTNVHGTYRLDSSPRDNPLTSVCYLYVFAERPIQFNDSVHVRDGDVDAALQRARTFELPLRRKVAFGSRWEVLSE